MPPGSVTSAYNRYFTDRRSDFFRGFQLDLVSGIGNNDLAAMRGELCHPGLLFLMFFHERSCQRSLVVMLALVPRENNERYIPIKFSVRGRDLESTVREAQGVLAEKVRLPERYRIEWAGEYDQLKDEQKRLAVIVPLAMLMILLLLYTAFDSIRDAALVLATVPFALIGGVFSLLATGTAFSISAAVGVISTLGVAILGGVLLIARIEDYRKSGLPLEEAITRANELATDPS